MSQEFVLDETQGPAGYMSSPQPSPEERLLYARQVFVAAFGDLQLLGKSIDKYETELKARSEDIEKMKDLYNKYPTKAMSDSLVELQTTPLKEDRNLDQEVGKFHSSGMSMDSGNEEILGDKLDQHFQMVKKALQENPLVIPQRKIDFLVPDSPVLQVRTDLTFSAMTGAASAVAPEMVIDVSVGTSDSVNNQVEEGPLGSKRQGTTQVLARNNKLKQVHA